MKGTQRSTQQSEIITTSYDSCEPILKSLTYFARIFIIDKPQSINAGKNSGGWIAAGFCWFTLWWWNKHNRMLGWASSSDVKNKFLACTHKIPGLLSNYKIFFLFSSSTIHFSPSPSSLLFVIILLSTVVVCSTWKSSFQVIIFPIWSSTWMLYFLSSKKREGGTWRKAIDIYQQRWSEIKIMGKFSRKKAFIIPFCKLNTNMIRIFSWFINIILLTLLLYDLITTTMIFGLVEKWKDSLIFRHEKKTQWNFLINFQPIQSRLNSRTHLFFLAFLIAELFKDFRLVPQNTRIAQGN